MPQLPQLVWGDEKWGSHVASVEQCEELPDLRRHVAARPQRSKLAGKWGQDVKYLLPLATRSCDD
jgi:hypothetical protein